MKHPRLFAGVDVHLGGDRDTNRMFVYGTDVPDVTFADPNRSALVENGYVLARADELLAERGFKRVSRWIAMSGMYYTADVAETTTS